MAKENETFEVSGVVERLTPKGFILSDKLVCYSPKYRGPRMEEKNFGQTFDLKVHTYKTVLWLDQILKAGSKDPNYKPPVRHGGGSYGGGGRWSPQDPEQKRQEGERIGRSVALDRSIDILKNNIPLEKVLQNFPILEKMIRTGEIDLSLLPGNKPSERSPTNASRKPDTTPDAVAPTGSPPGTSIPQDPAKRERVKRLDSKRVTKLFNRLKLANRVTTWEEFAENCGKVLNVEVKNPFDLSPEAFAEIESYVNKRLSKAEAA